MSPSSDLFSKNRSLRESSEKKSGGQIGHKGHTLFQSWTPDEVIELKKVTCSQCGAPL